MTQCERLGGLLNYYYRSGQNNRFFRRYETEDRRDEPRTPASTLLTAFGH